MSKDDKIQASPDTIALNPEFAHLFKGGNAKRDQTIKAENFHQKGLISNSEHDEQVNLFIWKKQVLPLLPEIKTLHAIPNGQYREGERPEAGLTSGVPDVCLPYPMRHWHGFYGELKVGTNTTSSEQDEMIKDLRNNGYYVVVTYGWVAMAQRILRYLEREDVMIL